MRAKARQFVVSPKTIGAVLLMAALTFNNWFMGLFLNHWLFFKGGAVSEFSASGQPYAMVFRSLDTVSGVLFIAAALLLLQYQAQHGRKTHYVLIMLTAVFGIANCADALIPLHCAITLGPSCDSPVRLGLSHFSIPGHGYSSVIIAFCYLALPTVGYLFARRANLTIFKQVSLALITISSLSLLIISLGYVFSHSISERAMGPSQELQMIAFSLWFIAWYDAILPIRAWLLPRPATVPVSQI